SATRSALVRVVEWATVFTISTTRMSGPRLLRRESAHTELDRRLTGSTRSRARRHEGSDFGAQEADVIVIVDVEDLKVDAFGPRRGIPPELVDDLLRSTGEPMFAKLGDSAIDRGGPPTQFGFRLPATHDQAGRPNE